MIDVVLPCLDKTKTLPWVLGRMPTGYRAIVVDNGSSDGSPEVAAAYGARGVHESRRGVVSACHAGLRAATGDIVCFMDADASLDPEELPKVTRLLAEGNALALGRRRPTGRGAWPPHARLGNAVVARRIGLRDLGHMRAARRERLLALGLTDRRSLQAVRDMRRVLEAVQ